MKRAIALIIITLMMAAILGCGGGSGSGTASSSGTSNVTIAIAGLRTASSSVSAQSSAASITFTISALDMDTITRTVPVTGDTITESFVVPNGTNRHFFVKALASDTTTVLSEGDASSDLDGTAKNINIAMGVEVAGEWTFTFMSQDGRPEIDFITFAQAGNSLSISGATASASLLQSVLSGTGTVVGNDIQFNVTGSGCGNASSVAGTGAFYSDGTLGGTFTQTGGCGNSAGSWHALRGHITPPPQGSVAGTVTDAQAPVALSGVTVKLFQQGSLITSGATNSNGVYSLPAPAGSGYSVEFSKSGYITKTIDNITIASNTITTVDAALTASSVIGQGTVSGTVTDTLGNSLAGVTVRLLSGNTVVATVTNNQDGTYSITGPAASGYTVEFSKTGYITSIASNVTITANSTTPNVNATLSLVLAEGQTRIVLTWGANPSDLDSHLTGPIPDSTSRFHVFFGDPCYPQDSCTFDSNSNTIAGSTTDALLDHDTTDHSPDNPILEPETTTIVQQISGVYRFSVHDFTNRVSTSSTALSNSGAQVNVYQGNALVATLNVPTNTGGTLWTVFELNGNMITLINTMTFVSDETTIQSASGKVNSKKANKKGTKR